MIFGIKTMGLVEAIMVQDSLMEYFEMLNISCGVGVHRERKDVVVVYIPAGGEREGVKRLVDRVRGDKPLMRTLLRVDDGCRREIREQYERAQAMQ